MLPPVCSLSCIKIVFTVQLLCSSFYYLLHSCFPNCVSGDLWSSLLCPQDDGLLSGLRLCGGLGSFPTSHRVCGGLGSFHTSHRLCGGLGSCPHQSQSLWWFGQFSCQSQSLWWFGQFPHQSQTLWWFGQFPCQSQTLWWFGQFSCQSQCWAVLGHERRQWELFLLDDCGNGGCVFYMMN